MTCDRGMVCSHGQLKRSCEICERDARIAELEAKLVEAKDMGNFYEAELEHRKSQLKSARERDAQIAALEARLKEKENYVQQKEKEHL